MLDLRLACCRRGLLFSWLFCIRRQDGVESVAFLPWPEFYNSAFANIFNQALKNSAPQSGTRHLTPTEKDRSLDLVAFIQEAQYVVLLGFVIVIVHVDAELHFLHRDCLLVLLGLALFLLLLVQKFPIIHDAANRRLRCWGNLYQVKVLFAGHFEGFKRGHDTNLLAFITNHANFAGANTIICADKSLIDTNLRLFSTVWDKKV